MKRLPLNKRHNNDHHAPEHGQPRLLYSRRQARPLLGGISTATMLRLEKMGVLIAIKPGGLPTGMTFYSRENLLAVARRGTDDE